MPEAGEVPDGLFEPIVVVGSNDVHTGGGRQGTADDHDG